EGELPAAFKLGQNYPNPFNPATTIDFSLPEMQNVRLTVYDGLGREVRVLVNGNLSAGTHEVSFDAADIPSGVYFYRLEAAGQSLTQTMILMK
ncbi:MAG: T9SS type A sorting domain-containing protein, partial [Rhodothermales bacterium]